MVVVCVWLGRGSLVKSESIICFENNNIKEVIIWKKKDQFELNLNLRKREGQTRKNFCPYYLQILLK